MAPTTLDSLNFKKKIICNLFSISGYVTYLNHTCILILHNLNIYLNIADGLWNAIISILQNGKLQGRDYMFTHKANP